MKVLFTGCTFNEAKLNELKEELKYAEFIINQKRHIAMDIEEYFKSIREYLDKQKDIDKSLLNNADSIERFISEIERKYESILFDI